MHYSAAALVVAFLRSTAFNPLALSSMSSTGS
jgi:hypothetical protein